MGTLIRTSVAAMIIQMDTSQGRLRPWHGAQCKNSARGNLPGPELPQPPFSPCLHTPPPLH
eukprot:m.479133 g.479133  ORF g.479133 m.479133 type:complete len:61 (-) comp21697_c0_seq1:1162-1344(-)